MAKAKLTAEEQEQLLEELAIEVRDYLKDMGAVRRHSGEVPGKHFPVAITKEIFEALEISPYIWPAVKRKAWDLHLNVCLKPGTGHFLSNEPGEIISTHVFKSSLIHGLAQSLCRDFITLSSNGTLESGMKFARRLGTTFRGIPTKLKALEAPLPLPLEETIYQLTDGELHQGIEEAQS